MKIKLKLGFSLMLLTFILACEDSQSLDYQPRNLSYNLKIDFRPSEFNEIVLFPTLSDSLYLFFRRFPNDSNDTDHFFSYQSKENPTYIADPFFFQKGKFSLKYTIKNSLGIETYIPSLMADSSIIMNNDHVFHWLIKVKRRKIITFIESDSIPMDLDYIKLSLINNSTDTLNVDSINLINRRLEIEPLSAGKFNLTVHAFYSDNSSASIFKPDLFIGLNSDSLYIHVDSLMRKTHD